MCKRDPGKESGVCLLLKNLGSAFGVPFQDTSSVLGGEAGGGVLVEMGTMMVMQSQVFPPQCPQEKTERSGHLRAAFRSPRHTGPVVCGRPRSSGERGPC